MIKKIIYLVIISTCFLSCKMPAKKHFTTKYEVRSFPVDSGWGYSVYVNDKEFIRQTYLPVVSGKLLFKSKDQSQRTGEYVVEKIKRTGTPSLSEKDIETLHLVN